MSSSASQISWRRECDDRGVWTLWFDQPDRSYNVLDRPAIDELESHLSDAEADPSIVGLILRGGKPGGFCAGVDLKSVLACRTPSELEPLLWRGSTVVDHLTSVRLPTLAVIHGVCLGGGLELALACRRRVALASMEPLQIGLPEVHFGLVPAWGGITRLPRLIDPDDALDLLVSGRSIGYLRRGPWDLLTAWPPRVIRWNRGIGWPRRLGRNGLLRTRPGRPPWNGLAPRSLTNPASIRRPRRAS